ncbi:Fungal specific transcription factor domain-containing protein [Pleurostoma richardsiae]|uniref:Fungal specific transcription factor domain-containing protein n=1 Tax=Pleurostoma richardsiae TaxID=41990 RepID=A0AA38RM07_9PEZI|nr:Fungal specific transcription factor domain-containing protein [Pleurostoma richardsiae]
MTQDGSGSSVAKPTRRRATKACIACRSRKVRCDVSLRGQPCTNCSLDHKNCLVVGRASRIVLSPPIHLSPSHNTLHTGNYQRRGVDWRDFQRIKPTTDRLAHPVPRLDALPGVQTPDQIQDLELFDDPDISRSHSRYGEYSNASSSIDGRQQQTQKQQQQQKQQKQQSHCQHSADVGAEDAMSVPMSMSGRRDESTMSPPGCNKPESSRSRSPLTGILHPAASPSSSPVGPAKPREPRNLREPREPTMGVSLASKDATVLYSRYSFLAMGNLHSVPPQDVNYLESQGCLHVPTRPSLDSFMEHYFLHVHVFIAVLNEGDFWDMYYQNETPGGSKEKISLLLFQSMLFAASNFVSAETIHSLGFPSILAARTEFHRRAKLLYDMETEGSPLPVAQAALLLTTWVPPFNTTLKPYSTWMSIAIQHARSIGADRIAEAPEESLTGTPEEIKTKKTLRRLWWCCILGDRISPLATRRSLQITRDNFDFDASKGFGAEDLEDEISRSSVYNVATKRVLARVLGLLTDLCIILTDVLTLTFPFQDAAPSRRQWNPAECAKIRECDAALNHWYRSAISQFPGPGANSEMQKRHKSVVLHVSLLYIYYHSATIALYHHEILYYHNRPSSRSSQLDGSRKTYPLRRISGDLQDANFAIAACFAELSQRRLVRYLPITAVALLSIPLALHAISAKLSQGTDTGALGPTPAIEQNKKRLDMLIEAMRTFQPQYYGTDWVSEAVRYAVDLAQSTGRSSLRPLAPGTPTVRDWVQLLHTNQALYLRIIITVDLCISKSKLPEELDYPICLRSYSESTQSTSGSWRDSHMLGVLGMDLRAPAPAATGQATFTSTRSGTGNHNLADALATTHDDDDYCVDMGDVDFSGLGGSTLFGNVDPRIFDHTGGLGAELGGGASEGVFCSRQDGETDFSEEQSVREWLTISEHFQ